MSRPLDEPARTTPLPAPGELVRACPLSAAARECVEAGRRQIRDVLHGRDAHRLLVLIGPCSIHDPAGALQYARKLAVLADATRDALVVVMRTYFDKPRTTTGWKGLIRDPYLDGSGELAVGLQTARRLLCELGDLGLACGSELLDPLAVPYLHDGLAWGVIGARTSESQTHRDLASGMAMPIGFKNGVRGELGVAHDAIVAASRPAAYLGLTEDGRPGAVRTRGNPDLHLVLRGGDTPNYGPRDVARALAPLPAGPARPLVIDCSHGNSGGDSADVGERIPSHQRVIAPWNKMSLDEERPYESHDGGVHDDTYHENQEQHSAPPPVPEVGVTPHKDLRSHYANRSASQNEAGGVHHLEAAQYQQAAERRTDEVCGIELPDRFVTLGQHQGDDHT